VHAFFEFFDIQRARLVVISDLELAAKTHDTAVSTGSELGAEGFDQLGLGVVHGRKRALLILLMNMWCFAAESRGNTPTSLGSFTTLRGGSIVASPALLGDTGAVKVPGAVHHELEVVVAVDACRDVVVIFFEFSLCHDVVGGVVVSHVVSSFKGLEEFLKDLLLSLLASKYVGMFARVVDTANVVDVDEATLILVENSESLGNDGLAVGVHWTADGADEFVVFNEAASIVVKEAKQTANLALAEAKHVVLHGLVEFILVKGHGVVVVHDSELLSQSDNSTGTAGGQLGAEAFEEVLSSRCTAGGGSSTNIAAEQLRSEFLIVDSTAHISVVALEKRIQVLSRY